MEIFKLNCTPLILAEQGLKIVIGALVSEVGDEDLHHLEDEVRAF